MKLIENIGEPAMLEQLAEECVELAHAALKLSRVLRGVNPTPKTERECCDTITEEMADVAICMDEIMYCEWWKPEGYTSVVKAKRKRIRERLEDKNGQQSISGKRDNGRNDTDRSGHHH